MMQNKTTTTASAKDFCQTPPYALQPLYQYIPQYRVIWECASGEGYLVRALQDRGYVVVQSDIIYDDKWDFISMTPPGLWDVIITNPPFSKKYKFIERCYELCRPWALLMPVETLGAARAQRLFERYDMELILLSKRVDFKMPNKKWSGKGSHFPVAWFTHGLNIGRQISYYELDKSVDNPALYKGE